MTRDTSTFTLKEHSMGLMARNLSQIIIFFQSVSKNHQVHFYDNSPLHGIGHQSSTLSGIVPKTIQVRNIPILFMRGGGGVRDDLSRYVY